MKEDILNYVTKEDYEKGRYFPSHYIKLINKSSEKSSDVLYTFRVKSEYTNRYYTTQFHTHLNKIKDVFCSCPQFYTYDSCKHISACLINNQELFYDTNDPKNIESKSNYILNILKNENQLIKKEELFLKPYIEINKGYYKELIMLKAKIGNNKYYSLIGKFNSFKDAYDNNLKYKFGTNLLYDGKKHFFNKQATSFIEYINYIKNKNYANGNSIVINDDDIKTLFKIYPNGVYTENELFLKIEKSFPKEVNLTKKNNKFYLTINNKKIYNLTEDFEYVLVNNIIYKLDNNQKIFLSNWSDINFMKLEYNENQFDDIQKNILGLIKDKLKLDETTKDIIINVKPDINLYFDLDDYIKCKVIFNYNGNEINYFDNNTNVIRDNKVENDVINELLDNKFIIKNNNLIIDDLDKSLDFIEKIDLLAQKYNVFTTEKIKNTNIIKNNNITSTFSIGKDNILHYDFDLGIISKDEINKVLDFLNNNKKYYKLKNGSILSLETDTLKELDNLKNDLELDYNDIKNGGIIPKYQALYLESLKKNKYEMIKTDNIFDEFINNFKEYQHVKLNFSKEESNVLRDYQKQGVKWLYTIHKCNLGGILADEMGLGKSLQTIIFIKKILREDNASKFLICCPTSLIYNWLNEFKKFEPKLNVAVFTENKDLRHSKLNNFKGNIYITSYGLLREDLEHYKKINFKVFIIDEAQNIKNPHAGITKSVKEINSLTKIALTGTPIENSIIELWSIFDFIMPGFLSSLIKFNKKYKIKEFNEETNKLLGNLKQHVKPFILRRKKQDVIKDLPKKIENNIYLDMTDEQKKYYAIEVQNVNNEMNKMINNGGFIKNKMMILRLLTRLRQICINPKIIYNDYKGDNCKITNLIKIIKELVNENHKILLFTSFKTALLMVKEELDKENISNYTIAGDVPSKQRQILVDSFNKDKTSVFLIMLKSGGTGLNLTSADIVIHLDLWWNPQVENQATDRAHRIGQTKTVEVIKLICKGTIEEKIIELQEKKKILSDKILEKNMEDTKYLEKLTEDDIRYMLAYENK